MFSPSVLLFYLGFNREIPRLIHHNFFFDTDLDSHLDRVFAKKDVDAAHTNFTFYVTATSRTDSDAVPRKGESDALFVLIPAPYTMNEKMDEVCGKKAKGPSANRNAAKKQQCEEYWENVLDKFERDFWYCFRIGREIVGEIDARNVERVEVARKLSKEIEIAKQRSRDLNGGRASLSKERIKEIEAGVKAEVKSAKNGQKPKKTSKSKGTSDKDSAAEKSAVPGAVPSTAAAKESESTTNLLNSADPPRRVRQ